MYKAGADPGKFSSGGVLRSTFVHFPPPEDKTPKWQTFILLTMFKQNFGVGLQPHNPLLDPPLCSMSNTNSCIRVRYFIVDLI